MKREYQVIENIDDDLHCPICSDVFYKPIKTSCGHKFCGRCIVNWLNISKTCPCCRKNTTFDYEPEDALAKQAEKSMIKCLRCHQWIGQLGEFNKHRTTNCSFIKTETENNFNLIEILEDEVVELGPTKKVKTDQNQSQQNYLIFKFISIFGKILVEIQNGRSRSEQAEEESDNDCDEDSKESDESIQEMNEREIKQFNSSQIYLTQLFNRLDEMKNSILEIVGTNDFRKGNIEDQSFMFPLLATLNNLCLMRNSAQN